MEVLEEQNPIQTAENSKVREKKTTFSNSAGRPKRNNEIKFGPQPRSIVSQLLQQEKERIVKQEIEKKSKEIIEDYPIRELSDEPKPKKPSKSQESKTYNCEYQSCTYTTTSSSNMIKHKRRHTSEKPYMCDQCTFRTNFINSLTVHKRIHSGERPFVCEHCSYRCNSSSNLKKHCMHKHTGIT